jgi:hypothetical protein
MLYTSPAVQKVLKILKIGTVHLAVEVVSIEKIDTWGWFVGTCDLYLSAKKWSPKH